MSDLPKLGWGSGYLLVEDDDDGDFEEVDPDDDLDAAIEASKTGPGDSL